MPQAPGYPFYCYVDEFMYAGSAWSAGWRPFIREYGVGLVLANQFLDQLSEELQKAIFGNFGHILAFAVGAFDAKPIAAQVP